MQNAKLDEAQAGIKIAGRNTNNFRYADETNLMAESKENIRASFFFPEFKMDFFFSLKDNFFTEFCGFLSCINKNQP